MQALIIDDIKLFKARDEIKELKSRYKLKQFKTLCEIFEMIEKMADTIEEVNKWHTSRI